MKFEDWLPWALLAAFSLALFFSLVGCKTVAPRNSHAPADAVFEIRLEKGHGTGFHIGNGYVISAAHVVAPNGAALPMRAIDSDKRVRNLSMLWATKVYDIALLKIDNWQSMRAIDLDCDTAPVGRSISAHGYPESYGRQTMNGFVSSIPQTVTVWKTVIGMDLTILPGMSGGPVLAEDNRAIGVTVSSHSIPSMISVTPTGLSFAVPISTVCQLLGRI